MKYVYFQLWRRYNTITLSSTLEKLLIDVDGISALEMARYSNVLQCHPRAFSMVFGNFCAHDDLDLLILGK